MKGWERWATGGLALSPTTGISDAIQLNFGHPTQKIITKSSHNCIMSSLGGGKQQQQQQHEHVGFTELKNPLSEGGKLVKGGNTL